MDDVAAYACAALATDQRSDGASLDFALLGLFGEAGSLLAEVKKRRRDAASHVGYHHAVREELGDVLWYLAIVADRAGSGLFEVCGLEGAAPSAAVTFSAMQPATATGNASPTRSLEDRLLGLAGQVGALVNDHRAGNRVGDRALVVARLRSIMVAVAMAAAEAGVTLPEAAAANLDKVASRWPTPEQRVPVPLFDERIMEEERLPRRLEIEIFERAGPSGGSYVFQRINGVNVGDRLTDNIREEDGYRFHDVFHYAYAAVLGWSPVLRSLLKLKRKSQPEVDEAEDGARAAIIEEGISTWVFGQGKRVGHFEGLRPGQMRYDLLKTVRQFAEGFEVHACPPWMWEEAILQGHDAFRFLLRERSALITVDLDSRTLAHGTLRR